MYELECPKCGSNEIVVEEEGIRQIEIGVDKHGELEEGDVTDEFEPQSMIGYRCVSCWKGSGNSSDFLVEVNEATKDNSIFRKMMSQARSYKRGECPLKKEIAVLESSVVPLDDESLKEHLELISKRKETTEAQMIALAKEMWIIALYIRQCTISVQNCKFIVDMSVADQLDITFRLLQESNWELRKRRWNTTKTIRGLWTWKELIPKVEGTKVGNSILRRDDVHLTHAKFSVTKSWFMYEASFPHSFVKLLPTARMLVAEQLGALKIEAEDDIEFVAGTESIR